MQSRYKLKKEIAKWFLINSPAGEIQYVAKDLQSVLQDEKVFDEAALEAFPIYNKAYMISLEYPNKTGEIMVTSFNEIAADEFIDHRTAQVATVNHVKQVCTAVRPATDDDLLPPYVEKFRCALDAEILKYVTEAYPNGFCSVFCVSREVEGPGTNFELVVVISAAKCRPKNFCYGSWRSIWNLKFMENVQKIEIKGKLQVGAHYFEEGNVQLDSKHECDDTTLFQPPDDSAVSVANIIRHHEGKYLASLEVSCSKLPDTTFKDLRRKLPISRTLFPWHNTLQFSLTRDIQKQLGIGK